MILILPSDTEVVLSPFLSSAWNEKVGWSLFSALEQLRRHVDDYTPFQYPVDAPRANVRGFKAQSYTYKTPRINGSYEVSMKIENAGCSYSVNMTDILMAVEEGMPIDVHKAQAAKHAINLGLTSKYSLDVEQWHKHNPRPAAWKHAEFVVPVEFTQGNPYWVTNRGLPYLEIACFARAGGLAVYE